ncbi:histidine phosphotransferase family protein, partial [Roseomonas sp. 18066]|uniref:histidine phosphotransferase family protein n=1 Tax=Roseomonas sp. 18066 TaxID=2681412 RepID=UPI001F3BFF78
MDAEAMLAQDLCARLCHDLVGPLGTVAGAIDLLAEEPEAGELARDAAAELRRRLKFWRAACGAGTGPLAVAEVEALLEGMLAGGRATLDIAALPANAALPAPVAQLLLVAAMLAGEALPRGGVVQVTAAARQRLP